MASFADLSPIIVIFCVVGFFALFLGWVGEETPTYITGVSVPDLPNRALPASLLSYINGTLTYFDHTHGWTSTGTINNGSIPIKLYSITSPFGSYFIQVDSFDWGWFGVQVNFEHFKWYTDSSKTVCISDIWSGTFVNYEGMFLYHLDDIYADLNNSIIDFHFYIANSRTSSNVVLVFDNTTYATPTDAFLADALAISFDAGYNEDRSVSNAFTIITGLLFWSLPGVPSWVFALVDLAFFAPAIYVLAIWILRVLGSIFGGGGGG